MSGPLVIAHLPTVGGELRQKQIDFLRTASEYAIKNEAGVLKYAAFDATDSSDNKSIYVFEQSLERYQSQEAFDSHTATQGVQDMITFMSSGTALEGAPTVHMLEIADDMVFSRQTDTSTSDAHAILSEVVYEPSGTAKSLPYWKTIMETLRKDEPKLLVFVVAKDPQDATKLFVIEVYEDRAALDEIHGNSKVVEESIVRSKHLQQSLQQTILKLNIGFLHR